jgi:transposase
MTVIYSLSLENRMQVVFERCCGLDVHKKMVVACLLCLDATGQRHKEIRTFRTTTGELLQLLDWLLASECSQVAMESTGIYWRPVYNLLEAHCELLVVNAHHIKAVPGRKTDVKDAEWIADLLQHGLLRGSFIPPVEQRELRDLTRYRTSLIQERTRIINRLQKTLEDTNLKLGDVVADIMGKSARAMLEALLEGQTDPAVLADLAQGRLRAKRDQLEQALVGTLKPHHRFLLTEHLNHIDELDEAMVRVDQEIEERMGWSEPTGEELPEAQTTGESGEEEKSDNAPLTWKQAVMLLDTIPGINQRAAETILSEIGIDMTRFPSAGHLASWAGICPGNHESAGKRLSGKTRKGSSWLRRTLVEAAHGAAHKKNTYFSALYRRLATRCGKQKALLALAHTILVICYHLLARKKPYEELGENYFDERHRQHTQKRLVRQLEKLGFQVELQPVA